jgi:cyclopropane fatty-acyl-phospholipid synthase-like methyltransferase
MTEQKEWFVEWFDTKFYHILYQDRNDEEAQLFMQNLLKFLKLKKGKKILDLACGRGRHSVYLNSLGYKVRGVDLSKNSIQYAKQFEKKGLKFSVHDMRIPFKKKYHAIFNLFTSFGYFNDDKTNIKVLKNIKKGLKKNGIAVIDFMNIETVTKNLNPKETAIKDDIHFHITREIINNKIIKNIKFSTKGKDYHYTEKVQCLTLETIKKYIAKAGLKLNHTFGDYTLNEFDVTKSKRLILIVSKK